MELAAAEHSGLASDVLESLEAALVGLASEGED